MAEGDGHFGRASLVIVCWSAFLVSRSNSNGIDAIDIAISCAGVKVPASIPRCPYIYTPFIIPSLYVS